MSHLIAAIDESLRPNTYLLCATVVSTADRVHIAHSLQGLLLPNQRRLHAKNENPGRKRTLTKALLDVEGIGCYVAVGPASRNGGRAYCLRLVAERAVELAVKELVIERPDIGAQRIDHEFFANFSLRRPDVLSWKHEEPARDPLLWVSDIVLSAYGSGGPLRMLVAPLIREVLR